ncbi:MAG: polysaccharide biosynthesis C-terminal domain-containing protein [Bacteroidetes bacterium]|nr:polysaccharide biosynthesis C-terminal domain-containing protein [Bacteroidota bacterium]
MSFQTRIRRLASETAIYGISSIVGRLINFLLFPLYSHVFLPSEYAPIIVIYAAFMFLNVLFQHGAESSYLKFATERKELTGRSSAFGTAMFSLLVVSSLLTVVMLLVRGTVADIIGLNQSFLYFLNYAAAILWLDSLATVPFADLRLRNRPWVFAAIRIVNILVVVGLNLILIFGLNLGVEAILISNVVASGVTLIMLAPTTIARFSRLDVGLWKKMILFGLPFIPGGIGYAVTERVNLFFLSEMDPQVVQKLYGMTAESHPRLFQQAADLGSQVFTEEIVGMYGGIIKLAVLMALFIQMFHYAWQPFFLQHQHDADAPSLFGKVFSILTLVMLVAFLGISFFVEELVQLPLPGGRTLIQSSYWMGLIIIPIALTGYFFQGWYYHFSAGAYLRNKSKFFLYATASGSIVALVLNAWFVPTGGMMAAAWATSAAYAVMALTLLFLIKRHYPIPYNWVRVLICCGVAAGVFLLWKNVTFLHAWWLEMGLVAVFTLFGAQILSLPITKLVRR